MSDVRERERLIARIRQIRRTTKPASAPAPATTPGPGELRALELRVEHLERLLESLQDSVHRESDRQSKLIAELQEQVKPAVMDAALSKNARDRGL